MQDGERDPVIAAFAASDDGIRRIARSPLTRWMRRNFGELRKRLDHPGVDWPHLAALLAQHGIVGRDGKPPTAEAVRKAWLRVKASASVATPGIPDETGSAPDAVAAAKPLPPPAPAHPSPPPAPREPDAQDGVARPDGPSPGPAFQFGIRPKRKDI